MKSRVFTRNFSLLISTAVLSACSPTYHFELRNEGLEAPNTAALGERLESILSVYGFEVRPTALAQRARAIGNTGYDRCEKSGNLQILEKEWRSLGAYNWVWVHSFTCDRYPKFVVSSSSNSAAESEAERIRSVLAEEFRIERETGSLSVSKRSRVPLE